MKDVFISFSSSQTTEAQRICTYLEEKGLSCFISTRDLISGEEYAAQLIKNIDESSVMVLLLSEASNKSPHVLREVEYAVSHHTPILVYSLEDVTLSKSMEYFLMTHQWITEETGKDERLFQSIEHLISKDSHKTAAEHSYFNRRIHINKPEQVNQRRTFVFRYMIPICCLVLLVVILVVLLQKNHSDRNSLVSDSTENQTTETLPVSYALGDTITLGTYYGEPIEWRVLQIREDNTLLLLSKYILTIKAYDAAEGGAYNSYEGVDYWSYENHVVDDEALLIQIRGNNDWSKSNIRTWLNSDKEVVTYEDQAPTKAAVGSNFYSGESGFLHEFASDERAALVEIELKSPANTFSTTQGTITTMDKVFLLSVNELKLLEAADISLYTKPTESCKAHDKELAYYNSFVEAYDTENYYWLLRDCVDGKINQVSIVLTDAESEETTTPASAGISSYGIRPVICVDASKLK